MDVGCSTLGTHFYAQAAATKLVSSAAGSAGGAALFLMDFFSIPVASAARFHRISNAKRAGVELEIRFSFHKVGLMDSSENARKRRSPRGAVTKRSSEVRVTERDTYILEALTKMRFLTTSQLARLFFGSSRWSANKRLRTLLDFGLVKVWVRSLSEDNIYSLAAPGLRLLKKTQGDEHGLNPIAPRGLDGNIGHLLAINQVRIALAVGLEDSGGELSCWKSDWDLRAHGRSRVIPDALFGIQWVGRQERVFTLEVDRNTKSPRNFLAKILSYESSFGAYGGLYGFNDFLVLVVGEDPKWVERYRSAVSRLRLSERLWFAIADELQTKGANEPIWSTADDTEKYSLRDLSFVPYGKEGTDFGN